MSERSGIEIDYCPKCRGVWLDRGELDKIIERSEKQVSSNSLYNQERSSPRNDNYEGKEYPHHQKHHKKESFWGELFD
jgi:hypothetical protein